MLVAVLPHQKRRHLLASTYLNFPEDIYLYNLPVG